MGPIRQEPAKALDALQRSVLLPLQGHIGDVMLSSELPANVLPELGQLVNVRSRRWLVERVDTAPRGESPLVRLACAEDDSQGQTLEVFWDYEVDAWPLAEEGWARLTHGEGKFDSPREFGSILHALRWDCVTATDARLVQSPFRAGIKLDAYQIEPLRKALKLPLVNLFIADDTGLGKTIEAALVAKELLLRKKVTSIVVSAPPSVLGQWRAELDERFGLNFMILDRAYLIRVRQRRGFGINPWQTHNFFLVSHNLLTDATYRTPLLSWLGTRKRGSLLILDEAHHAAPSSGGRFGIETKFTRAIRDIAFRFEHRLFLSATPHNGHSRSFSSLLELLDPQRFTRGVKVRKKELGMVMVRRLKNDIRRIQGGFPVRKVIPIQLDGLPNDTPELVLSRLLDEYRKVRVRRFRKAAKRAQATSALLVIGLQQRLLSSIEAFARSLAVHSRTVHRHRQKELDALAMAGGSDLLDKTAGADDVRSTFEGKELAEEEDHQVEAATVRSEAGLRDADESLWRLEESLREKMRRVAESARAAPDVKVRWLLGWMRVHLCGRIGLEAEASGASRAWTDKRVLIFTENRQSTKVYLRNMLRFAIQGTELADERIEVIDGLTSVTRRKEIQRRFNAPPSEDPLRILLATDAAREGLNFQAHCSDLFHYDLPWNPGRIEQRNGRIDRKLQPESEVRCHYFVLPQRAEDRVLEVLVKKTQTIKQELGSLANVIEESIEERLRKGGIPHESAEGLAAAVGKAGTKKAAGKLAANEELESARTKNLNQEVERCRRTLSRSRQKVDFSSTGLRNALSCALEMQGVEPLKTSTRASVKDAWDMPSLDRLASDNSWALTLDSLREPRKKGEKFTEWRRDAPIRPVVFEDPGTLTDEVVHVHLEQRLAYRLLSRFRSQGFLHHDLSRTCVVQSEDSLRRVVLFGRLLLFGQRAERLHEELVAVAAQWREPSQRAEPLRGYGVTGSKTTLDLLDRALEKPAVSEPAEVIRETLVGAAERDIEDLLPQLKERCREAAESAENKLRERGEEERSKLERTLEEQQERVRAALKKEEARQKQEKGQKQMKLAFRESREDRQEAEAHMRMWRERLEEFKVEIERDPKSVRDLYNVATRRLEPVGLVYLWPATN